MQHPGYKRGPQVILAWSSAEVFCRGLPGTRRVVQTAYDVAFIKGAGTAHGGCRQTRIVATAVGTGAPCRRTANPDADLGPRLYCVEVAFRFIAAACQDSRAEAEPRNLETFRSVRSSPEPRSAGDLRHFRTGRARWLLGPRPESHSTIGRTCAGLKETPPALGACKPPRMSLSVVATLLRCMSVQRTQCHSVTAGALSSA